MGSTKVVTFAAACALVGLMLVLGQVIFKDGEARPQDYSEVFDKALALSRPQMTQLLIDRGVNFSESGTDESVLLIVVDPGNVHRYGIVFDGLTLGYDFDNGPISFMVIAVVSPDNIQEKANEVGDRMVELYGNPEGAFDDEGSRQVVFPVRDGLVRYMGIALGTTRQYYLVSVMTMRVQDDSREL